MATQLRPDPSIVYHSDTRPDFAPFQEDLGSIPAFVYAGDVASEVASGTIDRTAALALLDDMLAIREMEEMIVRLRGGGGYGPLPGYDYRGPTHVSIGQEGSAVGASSALRITDNVTSSHRGHGDAIAKGFSALRQMSVEQLEARLGRTGGTREALLDAALEENLYRVIAELFGKDEGYCRGRGGGMHIGDFFTGNLGANAIVGGSVPIATGAAMARRYQGPHATELIAEASLAMVVGANATTVGCATHPHPTLSEILGEAALAVDGRSINV